MVDMPITFKFKLWKGIKRLDINIKIRNHSRNHRVRAVFTFPMEFDSIKANEIFCTEDFSVEHPPITAEWKENPTRELPFRDWISVSDDVHRCTLAAKGLYVFESLDKNSIAFTLFRSVGELMRINVKDREGCCAAGYPVDGAQCLIEMTYDCALFIHSANDSVYDIHRMTEQFILPPAVHPIRRNEEIEADSAFAELFRFIDNKSFAVSVFEQSYDREYFVLRFYEINGENGTAKIDLLCFNRVYMSDMNETIIDELKMNNGIVEIDVQANKVITLMLKK